jgi:sugar lactone lactonase YvrE
MSELEHVLAVSNELGEGPLWISEEQALYWVDIPSQHIHRFYPSTGKHDSWEFDVMVTALGARASGGFVAGTSKGLAFWDPASPGLSFFANPEADKPSNRFNDGAVDAQGRFWAGTMNKVNTEAPDGALYRVDPDGSVHQMDTGFSCSNGGAWSLDSKTMYFTDTMRRVIWAYDFDADAGSISNRRPFAQIAEEEGYPDGHIVDSEGFLWTALWGGWKIVRYDPTGKIEREIRLPAENITKCAFGGENLDELYITTAWETLSDEDRKNQPLAGDLFRVKVGIKGLPAPKFAG